MEKLTQSRHPELKSFAWILGAAVGLLCVAVMIVWFPWRGSGGGPHEDPRTGKDLEIIVYREDASKLFWTLNGRVLLNGDNVSGARVWAIAEGWQGDRDSPEGAITGSDGQFKLTQVPKTLDGKDVRVTEIYARLVKDNHELKGLETLSSAETLGSRIPGVAVIISVLAGALFFSMILPFLGRRTLGYFRYVMSMALAVVFSFGMIAALAYARYKLSGPGMEARYPLGFISIFQGTYVQDGPQEWLISLSDHQAEGPRTNLTASSSVTGDSPAASTGFGAPLWVLLLAALGSGILTVSLITHEIRVPPKDDQTIIRDKIYNAVQHQVYVLFSPISAIFVYQALIMTDTAGQPLVVALATLGAGAALKSLLMKAVDNAQNLFSKSEAAPTPHAKVAAAR
jgi:hypothetical protein